MEFRVSRSSDQKIASLRLHMQVSVYMFAVSPGSFLLPLARIQLEDGVDDLIYSVLGM